MDKYNVPTNKRDEAIYLKALRDVKADILNESYTKAYQVNAAIDTLLDEVEEDE